MPRGTKSTPPPAPAAPALQQPGLGRARNVTLALGVITFAAKLHGAVADQADPLVNACASGHPATKVKRTDACPECKNEDKATFAKAVDNGGELILVDAEQLAAIRAKDEAAKDNLELQVVEADETLMVAAGRVYYIAPGGTTAAKNYALIAAAISQRPKLAFLAEMSFGGAPTLFRLGVEDDALVLREIARPETVRERPRVSAPAADEKALKLVLELADGSAVPFDPREFRNEHAEAVAELAEAARGSSTGDVVSVGGDGDGDLLAQLQAKIDAMKTPKAPARRRTRKVA